MPTGTKSRKSGSGSRSSSRSSSASRSRSSSSGGSAATAKEVSPSSLSDSKATTNDRVEQAVRENRGARPVHVDSSTARSDSDVGIGHFAEVHGGDHDRRYGVVVAVSATDEQTGYPTRVVLETRDEHAERIEVDYDSLRPATAGRR